MVSRRVLGLGAASAAWVMATSCKSRSSKIMDLPAPAADARLHYGQDVLQFGDLRMPQGPGPHPVAIVIHGGFWRARYGLEYAGHMAAALTAGGIATWNVEYRRVGNPGGGWPGTLLDTAAAADYVRQLAKKYPLSLEKVISIGHSSGGHLSVWLAARHRIPQGDTLASADSMRLRGAISLAGLVDLRRAWELKLGDGAVEELMGGPPAKLAERYRTASPIELVPLGLKVRLLHGTEDSHVPIEISNGYQKAASRAGDDARLVVLGGADHFAVVDPRSEHWATVEKTAREMLT
jgi:acetyl esterase/lipase